MLVVNSVVLGVNDSNVDVPGEGWDCLPLSIVGNNLGNSPVTGRVPAADGLRRPVPALPCRARAAVTPVPGLPQVPVTGRVGLPGPVNRAERVYILTTTTVVTILLLDQRTVTFPVVQSNLHLVLRNPWAQYPGMAGQVPGICSSTPGSCSMQRGMSVQVPSSWRRVEA